jgi:uncharacterized membrane protein
MYLLGRRLFGRGVGLLSALLLAISTCAIVYSQEARGYSWLLLGTIVSTYLFVRLMEQPGIGVAFAYALAAGVTFYFHYFGLLVPVAHGVSLFALPRERRPWKELWIAAVVLVLLAAPVLWMIYVQPGRHLDWVQKPSLLEFYHLGVFLAAESGKALGPVLLAIEIVLVVVFFRELLRLRNEQQDFWRYVIVASGLCTPVIISLLVSVVRPVFFHRFLIICLPAWLLAVAVGTYRLVDARARYVAIALVCFLSIFTTIASYSRMREDWRGAANLLIDNASAQDVVVYYQGVGYFAAENYRDWLPGGSANRPNGVEVKPHSDDWRRELGDAKKVWLVEYPANLSDDNIRAVEAELHSRYYAARTTPFRAVTVTEFVRK